LAGRCLLYPFFGQNLLSVPVSFLQEQLSHLGKVFRFEVQPPASGIDALRAFLPPGVDDAKRAEQTGIEIIHHFLARHFLYDG
jgi:hypothetical protein